MAIDQDSGMLGHIRRALLLRDAAGMTDGQLLESFLARRDEAAFEALVRRHGPMVLGVCTRVLRNTPDAEDAFQATFLVLARKAGSVRPREAVGSFLYGVAYRTALKVRSDAARRRAKERKAGAMAGPAPRPESTEPDWLPLLDEELSRLPDKYRGPIVLCDLEGKSRRETARLLGWREGTLSGRLARARKLLAGRLARRGVGLSAAALGATGAVVPPALAAATARAAASFAAGPAAPALISAKVAGLSNGVLKMMLLARLKVIAAVVLGVGLVGAGTGVLTRSTPAAAREAALVDLASAPARPDGGSSGPEPVRMDRDAKRIARLAEQLRSKKWEERSAALAELRKLVPARPARERNVFDPVVPPLFALVGWGGLAEKESRAAADVLAAIGRPAVPLLLQKMKSAEAHDRWSAVGVLVRVDGAGVPLVPTLRPLLADRDAYVRRVTIEALGAMGPAARAAADDLKRCARDPEPLNQVRAHAALFHVRGGNEPVRALATYLRRQGKGGDEAAAFAADTLARLGRPAKAVTGELLAALRHPSAGVRAGAAAALAAAGADSEEVVRALTARLRADESMGVRRTAAVALGDLGPKARAAVPTLRTALANNGGGWWVAARALGEIGGPAAVAALSEALANPDADVRLEATRQLGNQGPAARPALTALRQALRDPRESNRKAAAAALEKVLPRP